MALTKSVPTSTETTIPSGSFEGMDGDTAVIDAPPAPAPANGSGQLAPASTDVTVKDRAVASAFAKEVESMRGALDFTHGNYSVFKGINGALAQTGGLNLGRWAKVTMIAWDEHYEISPSSDAAAAKEAVGYSKEGKTLDSVIGKAYANWVGKPVDEYVTSLQLDGFAGAKCGRFIDVACVVHETDSEDSLNGEIIQVTLSQTSIPSFSAYQERLIGKALAITRGVKFVTLPADPFTFYFVRQAAEKNGKSWTKLQVLDKLPAKL